jgi:hypothetical protein
MKERLNKFIECHVVNIDGNNTINIPSEYSFLVSIMDTLPIHGGHLIEGTYYDDNGESDEIIVTYTLIKFESNIVIYSFKTE